MPYWCAVQVSIPGLNETLSAWNMSKSVTVLERSDFSMSQRMRPIANLATDCILLCDDRWGSLPRTMPPGLLCPCALAWGSIQGALHYVQVPQTPA